MLPYHNQIRFDDRVAEGTRVGRSAKPPVLGRGTIAVLTLLMIAAVLYGTLVPFNFHADRPLNWQLSLVPLEPGDALANALVYVPVGALVRLMLRRRGSRWPIECLAGLLLATGISYTAEVLQQWLPGRVPTLTDTLCNGGGALVGTTLAPLAQRWLRRFHAWLFQAMQNTPFTATAGLLTVLVCVYALAPFDVRPTITHVRAALQHVANGWPIGSEPASLSPAAHMSKWMDAAAYGVLAFLLMLAGRETGRSTIACCGHAMTRGLAFVLSIEFVQLFTVSHVADIPDVSRGWACCAVGTGLAAGLLWMRPLIYRDPAALIGPVLPVLCPVLLAWLAAAILNDVGRGTAREQAWLPVMASFSRSWDALLFSYTSGLINYCLAVGTLVGWLRLRGRTPRLGHCLAAAVAAAGMLQCLALLVFRSWPDTGHIALAALAGLAIHRLDRALFGRKPAIIS